MLQKPVTVWRYFPVAALTSLGVVVVVNTVLAYAALSTFPDLATPDDFDTGNRYARVLDTAQRPLAPPQETPLHLVGPTLPSAQPANGN